jgi:hypothetical protein
MSTITEIERAVQDLAPAELAKFRQWFADFDAARWDHEIEEDVAAGRLDGLAAQALADLSKGHCKEL